MVMTIRPLGCGFGALITDVDLGNVAPSTIKGALEAAMMKHSLLIFKNQVLTPAQEVAFAKVFPWDENAGSRLSLQRPNHRANVPNFPMMIVQGHGFLTGHHDMPNQKLRQTQDTLQWHTDGLHQLQTPPVHTQMYAIEVPDTGGETLFASAHAMWAALSPSLQQRARTLYARYQTKGFKMAADGCEALVNEPLGDDIVPDGGVRGYTNCKDGIATDLGEVVCHPICIVHPTSGKPALFVAPMYTRDLVDKARCESSDCIGFKPLSHVESHALLGDLLRQGLGGTKVYRHVWERGDLVAWDNRSILHTATPVSSIGGGNRVIHRIRMASFSRPLGIDLMGGATNARM